VKLIIAGSRHYHDYQADTLVANAMQRLGINPTTVISGGAQGIDRAGERWARDNGVPIERYPADWSAHGRAAGPLRNRRMAQEAGALLLIWDGKSRGSANMLQEARAHRLRIWKAVVPVEVDQ
jgi:hypothetical protein